MSKTGKHGNAKCKFLASDIFTGSSCEELCPSTHSIDFPIVTKKYWIITGIQDDNYALLMNDNGDMREDLQLPNVSYKTDDDIKNSELIKEYCDMVDNGNSIDIYCTILSAVGKEKITEIRKKDV